MEQNGKNKQPKLTVEDQTKRMQEAMREHYHKLKTDEEYRKRAEENDKTLGKMFIFGADNES